VTSHVEVLDVDMDRERVSLSLKATQEDPWRYFARTHAIGRRARQGHRWCRSARSSASRRASSLVHISEPLERHVEVDQVVQVGDDAMVKVIDIDPERRRISLSLKQANEDYRGVRPSKYGMADADEQVTASSPRVSTPRPTNGSRLRSSEEWESPLRPSVGTRCTPRRVSSCCRGRGREKPLPTARQLKARGRWVAGQRRPAGGAARLAGSA
jgi:small subunit ribosomal protein S1